jgi:predicted nuclease with TOPRIM domain
MTEKNDSSSDESFDEIEESDETDWKAETTKLREKAIRQRDKTKELRSKISELETKVTGFEKKPTEKKSDDFGLLEKAFLRSSGYNDAEEIELFKKWKDDTGKPIDELVDHPFVKAEIENLRIAKKNQLATSNIKGDGSGESDVKSTPDYWIAKMDDQHNFPDDLPKGRKLRASIAHKLMEQQESGKKFYND